MERPFFGPWAIICAGEILFNQRRIAPWVLMGLFSLNALLWTVSGQAAAYGRPVNSDYETARLCMGFVFMTTPFFTALLMGDVILRDQWFGIDAVLLSKPIRSTEYILGKFLGNFIVLSACHVCFIFVPFVVQFVPTSAVRVVPWHIIPYLKHFFWLVLIPHFALAALCCTVGTLTRSVKFVYGLVTALYIAYITLQLSARNLPTRWLEAFDPLLVNWISNMAHGRSQAQLGKLVVTYNLDVLVNRGVLITFGCLCLAFLIFRFSRAGIGQVTQTGISFSLLFEQTTNTKINTVYKREVVIPPLSEHLDHRSVPSPSSASLLTAGERGKQALLQTGSCQTYLIQFLAAVGCEFRLLQSERSLFVLVPVVLLLCGSHLESFGNAFGAPFYPVSSVFATNSVQALVLVLSGITIFMTGEAFYRDDECNIKPILWSLPVPNSIFILSKFVSTCLLSLGFTCLTALTAMFGQWLKHLAPVQIWPYLVIYTVILLPSIMTMVAIVLLLNALLRNKYAAHIAGISLCIGLYYLFSRGQVNWLYNPVLYSMWTYSDMTGLEPYRRGIVLHRFYWLALSVASLGLAHLVFQRDFRNPLLNPARRFVHTRWPLSITIAAMAAALLAGITIQGEINRGAERTTFDEERIRYEDQFAAAFRDAPELNWTQVQLAIELFPNDHRLHARGTFRLTNRSQQPVKTILLTLDPNCQWQTLRLDGVFQSPQVGSLARVYTFEDPIAPDADTVLHAEWDAVFPQGLLRSSARYTNFIEPGGSFLGGPGTESWLPITGYTSHWEITDAEVRRQFGKDARIPLPDLKDAAIIPALFGQSLFDFRIEITVPAEETAIAAGHLVEVRAAGAQRIFVYESDHPVIGFPILSAPYAVKERQGCAVYYAPGHDYNIEKLLDGMIAARRIYERDFGPLPYHDLRLVEFPRLAEFAQGYPTTIPCSEGIAFLTRDDGAYVNTNAFTVAHEVAHQWFGNMVVPGRSRGAAVLLEGLAEYAAGAMIEESVGEQAAKVFRRYEETAYLQNRQVDTEPTLVTIDGSTVFDSVVSYQKAGLVFHMLEKLIGRKSMKQALKTYVARFAWKDVHPTIHDLISIFKQQVPDRSLDWFLNDWFFGVTLPDSRIVSAVVQIVGNEYHVEVTVENQGQGRVPVMVEVITGNETDQAHFQSQSIQVMTEPGKPMTGIIVCSFKPEKIVLDRSFDWLDADRENNEQSVFVP